MQLIIETFRKQLRILIEEEQQRRRLSTADMLASLQSHVSLPDFYRMPALALAAGICERSAEAYAAGELMDAMQEAIKAVYGAWIREHFRNV
jgi:hypothetical protein